MGLRSWVKRKAAQAVGGVAEIVTTGVETVAAGGTALAGAGVLAGSETLRAINDPFLGGALDEEVLDQTSAYARGVTAAATVKTLEPVTELVDIVDGGGISEDNFYVNVGSLIAAPPNSDAARQAEYNVGMYRDDIDYFSFQVDDTMSAISDPVEVGLSMAKDEAEAAGRSETAAMLQQAEEFMAKHGEDAVTAVLVGYSTPKLVLAAAARGVLKSGFFGLLLAALTIGRMTGALYNALKIAGLLIPGANPPPEEDDQEEEPLEEIDTKDQDIEEEAMPVMAEEPQEEKEDELVPFMDPDLPTDTRYRKKELIY